MKSRQNRIQFRRLRVRKNISGTSGKPRLSVYRSVKHIYAQIIDDSEGKTLAAASSLDKTVAAGPGVKEAVTVGELLGKRAIEKGIKEVLFDRGGRPYHGRIKALAEGARQAGLKF